jgi:hypothetical protein
MFILSEEGSYAEGRGQKGIERGEVSIVTSALPSVIGV